MSAGHSSTVLAIEFGMNPRVLLQCSDATSSLTSEMTVHWCNAESLVLML